MYILHHFVLMICIYTVYIYEYIILDCFILFGLTVHSQKRCSSHTKDKKNTVKFVFIFLFS